MTTCVTPRQVSNILSPLLSSSPTSSRTNNRSDNAYRELLASFSSYNWSNKPLPLSPLQCAKWGWQSTGKETLQCKTCKTRLHFVCTYDPWQQAPYQRTCKEFGIKLQIAHQPACPWSSRPLTDDVMLGGKSSLIYDKSEFFTTFFSLLKSFPIENVPSIEIPGEILRKLWPALPIIWKSVRSRDPQGEGLELTVANISLMILSLFGWRSSNVSDLPTVHCKLCLRTLGLWNFTRLPADIGSSPLELEAGYSWESARSYRVYPTEESVLAGEETCRSRETSSTSSRQSEEMSGGVTPVEDAPLSSGDTSKGSIDQDPDKEGGADQAPSSTPEAQEDILKLDPFHKDSSPVKFGNPDVFLPVASFQLFKKKEEVKKPEVAGDLEDGQESPSSPTKPDLKSPTTSTPSSRVLRSRSINTSTETPPKGTPRGGRKRRKTDNSTSPPTTMQTRSGVSVDTVTSPGLQPSRKRRRSKVELAETIIADMMRSAPTRLNLANSNRSHLDVLKQHHYWCPWVCKLPAYHISKNYLNTPTKLANDGHSKVSVVDTVDSAGWETLLFHLSTEKSPGNAWIAVHNMLQDCVSHRK